MYTFGPLIAKNARSGRLLGGAPVTVTTLDGITLDTYTVDGQPLTLVSNHEGYAGTFRADTDQRVILARPRGGDPLPLYAHEGIQDAAEAADTINTGRLSEASLMSTIDTRVDSSFGLVQVLATDIPGVDPSGETDSSAALNAWLAAPTGNVRRLWMPPGTYVGSLRATAPGVVIDAAPGATLKVPDGAVKGDTDAAIRVLADDVTINGLTIDGNQRGNPHIDSLADAAIADGIGIYANNTTVTNCHIYDPIGHGIIVWGLGFASTPAGLRSGYLIQGNRIEGGHNRAALDVAFNQGAPGETKGIINANRITGNTFVLHTANDVVVTGNYAEGMSFHSGCERLTVVGNVNSGANMLLLSCQDSTVAGNITQTLEVYPGTGTIRPQGMTITGNRVTSILNLASTDGAVVSSNTAGRINVDDSTDVALAGNRAELRIGNLTRSTDVSITGNHASNILLDKVDDFLVTGNYVHDSTQYGIDVVSASRGSIRSNRIRNTAGTGIRVGVDVSCTDIIISENDLDTIGAEGIFVGPQATDVTATDNTFRAVTGQHVRDTGTRTVLRNNGKSFGRLILPPASMLAEAPAAAWPAANMAILSRFTIDTPTVLRYLRFRVGTPAGNIQAGVVKFTSPTAFTRIMDSGIIATPDAGIVRLDLGPYTAQPGDYALFLWADNITFTTPWIASGVAQTARLTAGLVNATAGVGVTGVAFEGSLNRALLGVALETDL